MHRDAIVFAGLMPHAPILVPGVGREHRLDVRATVHAMTALARRAVEARPDALLLISPHSPRRPGAFGLWRTARLRGSLAEFDAESERVDLPLDDALADRLEREAGQRGLRTWRIAGDELDHGATVPLWFLLAAGWHGPAVIVSLNGPDEGGLDELGEAIAAAARGLRRRLAVIASGDMSHRLTPSAPCGFHADGRRFDEVFIALLRDGAPDEIRRFDRELADTAAEDVVESTRVALAAGGFSAKGRAVLSYEGPFGVGYGVAVLCEPGAGGRAAAGGAALAHFAELPAVARGAVAARLSNGPNTPPFRATGELVAPHGVFVTVRTADGELRGCQGSPVPAREDLVMRTWHFAWAAAFHDPRFAPVRAGELPGLRFSVSVLGPLENVASAAELDAARYGVVVAAPDGRRAVLLPAIAGIESVAEQLRIVKHKAGIEPDEPVALQRFTTQCFGEKGPETRD